MSKKCKRSVKACKMLLDYMFFAMSMIKYTHYFFIPFVLILFCGISCTQSTTQVDINSRTKVALRNAGHELLLSNGDSTSLVRPVVEVEPHIFNLTFENELAFDPDVLHEALKKTFETANLPKSYRVEVIQCNDNEVGYSYELFGLTKEKLVSCDGRFLPEECYTIQLSYTQVAIETSNNNLAFYGLVALVLAFLFFVFYSRFTARSHHHTTDDSQALGIFKFYPEQNMLIKEAHEISLSKKECELLSIFIEQPNQVIKREELMKRVWEDNGVFVGRSLDTYISKLRKKLQDDESLKISNVHGVGYKLEVMK